jgi:uncharacterized protein YecE (DUF72 family)
MPGRIVVGTSSWADPGFVADWYPPGLPARERLAYYAERFEAVEVNSTFYALPDRGTVEGWADRTPGGFTFDVKLHRLLSRHAAELDSLPMGLRDGAETTPRGRVRLTRGLENALAEQTLAAVEPLREAGKLSSFLLQLSPSFSPHRHELAELEPLVSALAPVPVAVEFRHSSWVDDARAEDTLGWLADHGAVFVGVDAPQVRSIAAMPPLDAVTNDRLAYLRLHGRNAPGYVAKRSVAERFGWQYADEELEEVRERAEALAEDAAEVRVMYNNNRSDDAPVAATRFRELLGQARDRGAAA